MTLAFVNLLFSGLTGVDEALGNEGVLPTILAGSSGGSIVAAIACTRRDRDIGAYLAGHRLANPDRDSGGGRIDPDKVADRLAGLIPDLTFQQAFEVSGRHLKDRKSTRLNSSH